MSYRYERGDDFPSRGRIGLWARFIVAAILVIGLTAGATATAGLLNVKEFVDDLKAGGTIRNLGNTITRADAGKPRTILLIGSDHRFGDPGADARSDTMILMRIDPDAPATTLLSIPRDLRVSFRDRRGGVYPNTKINSTYTVGGEALTARVIRDYFGIPINDVVNVNFRGFTRVIDAIGCVYVDVDRRYYHSNVGVPVGQQYSEIDLMPGYQMMCGERALSYVRYRHLDSDLVRSARQQSFLRDVRSQYDANDFINDPHRLTKVLGRHIQTDKNLLTVSSLIDLGKQIAFSAGRPIQQISMDPNYFNDPTTGESFVISTPDEIARVRRQFLHAASAPPPPRKPKPGKHGRRGRAAAPPPASDAAGLYDMLESGRGQAQQMEQAGKVRIPIYVPRWLPNANGYMADTLGEGGYPHAYKMHAGDGKMKAAYRLVVDVSTGASPGNYMGVQGLAWTDPPILKNPSSDHRTINGKKLDLYYDGKRLQLVAWRTPRAVYWISNSLQNVLTNDQMLRIAGSLTRVGGR